MPEFYEQPQDPDERRVRAVISKVAEWRIGPRVVPLPKWRATVGAIIEELEKLLDDPPGD